MTYSISIYSWPVSLIKELERGIRNFIWSSDKDNRKMVTVAWKKMCRPMKQGGLSLRSLQSLNSATNLHLCWTLLKSDKSWTKLLKDRVIRGGRTIQHHIYSSIWSSIKEEFTTITANSTWLLGNGESINFWNDSWCGPPLAEIFNTPKHISRELSSNVNDFILNGQWNIPLQLQQRFHNLRHLVQQVTIPMELATDSLQWKHTQSGDLNLKEAYTFKQPQFQELHWAKVIWTADVPPSKSLFVWRVMHDKLPTDENLMLRGGNIPSMCNQCLKHVETSFHIFFTCPFAINIWSWLAYALNLFLNFTCLEDIWKICDMNWSSQCKVVVTSALINLFNIIWFVRNQARFCSKNITWRHAITMITSATSLAGNATSKASNNSMRDFTILKIFNVATHQPRTPMVKEVIWSPPHFNWLKCNIDGASNGNPGPSAY